MLKVGAKIAIFLSAVFTISQCIDPYTPRINGYESYLVVEGLVTNENTSYMVKLSKTLQEQNSVPEKVSDAVVYITDDMSGNVHLKNMGSGIYKTDSTEFLGYIGRTYVLHIKTNDGEEYESEPCLMQSVSEIDSIYFAKEQKLTNNGTVNNTGVRIYLDSKAGISNKYIRWDFEEIWKFKVPYPKRFNYINDSTILPVEEVKDYCWKSKKSDEVLISSDYSGQNARIENEPIQFIDPVKSDRLRLQYSILVRQYSISQKEYDFWKNVKMLNESGSDIFASQPFPIISNIYNISNPTEKVLGYFSVSAVNKMRKYITFKDVSGMNLPNFWYPCVRIEMAPKDYPRSPLATPMTWDELYAMYCITSDYYFVEPKYVQGTSKLEKMVFAKPECSDCEVTGTRKKPDFWVDLN